MMRSLQGLVATAATLLAVAPLASGATAPDLGRAEYEAQCAQCHGPAGRGDGPNARELKQPVPDLTTLAQRAGGSFPQERLRRVIDGRDNIKGHDGRQMPRWGLRYARDAGAGAAAEAAAQQRIDALIAYLRSLQR
jgi:mono/diheme cytochrome c family protein